MRKFLLALALTVAVSSRSFSQGPPPPNGCDPFYALDPNNDGFTEFVLADFYAYIAVDAMNDHGWDISGYTMTTYPSQFEYDNGINPIGGESYFNILPFEQTVYVQFDYTGSGPQFTDQELYSMACWNLLTVNSNGDDDFDSVPNATEDLNGNGSLNDENTDGDVLFNFQDNDDDNDGLPTLNEDYNGNGNASDDDTDANGIPDYLENGIVLGIGHDSHMWFTISPNPSTGLVTVNFPDNENFGAKLSIFDISGKVLRNVVIDSPTVELSGLSAGIYMIKCESRNQVSVKKLIVL